MFILLQEIRWVDQLERSFANHPLELMVRLHEHEIRRQPARRNPHLDLEDIVALEDSAEILSREVQVLRSRANTLDDHLEQAVPRRNVSENRTDRQAAIRGEGPIRLGRRDGLAVGLWERNSIHLLLNIALPGRAVKVEIPGAPAGKPFSRQLRGRGQRCAPAHSPQESKMVSGTRR